MLLRYVNHFVKMRCAFIENVTICEPVYVLDAAFVNSIMGEASYFGIM